jgi:hypothetical protein
MDADRVAQRALELHEKASMPLAEALALALREAAPGPIWPIARLFIDSGGNVCGASRLYAPGLPEGEHDVYPLPVDAAAAPIAGVQPSQAPSQGDLDEVRKHLHELKQDHYIAIERIEKLLRPAGVDPVDGGQQG